MNTARPAHASHTVFVALGVVLALSLCGCGSTPPGASQSLVLQAPVMSTTWFADSDGAHIQLAATVNSHGARLAEVHVLVAREDGRPTAEPPTVTATGAGVVVDSSTQKAGVTVLRFAAPGVSDGAVIALDVEPAAGAPSPFRIRVTPVFVDPTVEGMRPQSRPETP